MSSGQTVKRQGLTCMQLSMVTLAGHQQATQPLMAFARLLEISLSTWPQCQVQGWSNQR